ncbi:MAG TPA: DUF1553 domain-containing protein [Pirellulales bacterium]
MPRKVSAGDVEFNRDVRPMLAAACWRCHGPDSAQRKADLRLDREDGAKGDRGQKSAIVPGDAAASEVMRRVTAADSDQRMPPPNAGEALTAQQVETLRRWIDGGAQWQPHWSFLAPVRPPIPAVKNAAWPRNEIDAFVLAHLESAQLSPATEADKITLLRRVTLDLTGLPPTPAEVDAFLADESPTAYETVVDRLLNSPRYGERMAAPWLDAARFADTNGYQTDGERTMWRWRDWLIGALNRNIPFDQFTIEQLAGDLLPNPTLEQRIATGFNRNHRGNGEGGIIAEEYAVEYAVDRVETTGTVWLGLTIGCARCHDHKYDPVTQREFYQLFALFNQVPERGRAVKVGNSPPFLKTPTVEQQERLTTLEGELTAATQRVENLRPQLVAALEAWESSQPVLGESDWSVTDDLTVHLTCEPNNVGTAVAQSSAESGDAVKPAVKTDQQYLLRSIDGDLTFRAGAIGSAVALSGHNYIDAGNVVDFGYLDKFTIACWVYRDGASDGVIWSRIKDEPDGAGYNLQLVEGRVQLNLVQRWLDDSLRVETTATLAPDRWTHVAVTYDATRLASGVKIYIDGAVQELRTITDLLYQTFGSKEPFRLGGGGPAGRLRGAIDDVRVYRALLPAEQIELIATPDSPAKILATPADKRIARQVRKLQAYYVAQHAAVGLRAAFDQLSSLRREHEKFVDSIPTTMVMEDVQPRRDTFLLRRGRYDQPGEKVLPGIPAFLPAAAESRIENRLGLARWLVDPANPLTARVTVNHYWQLFFGTGLVRSVDDFGAQGELPSHPELLDWLATEFLRNGWDVKRLQRTIVTSATYRQSSNVTAEQMRRDPENRLLGRGPRQRLSAEAIRDAALAASGLLVERIGGPSVKPYQPPRLWLELTGNVEYEQDHGADLYRRSIYTFVKRTVAPPTMVTFDSSPREACAVRNTRTNTPLQALVLMNDVTFVEAARVLAERVIIEAAPEPGERITRAFRLVLARPPTAAELETLLRNWSRQLAHFQQHPDEAEALVKTGEAARKTSDETTELAAYTAVVSLILNLDEAITKE